MCVFVFLLVRGSYLIGRLDHGLDDLLHGIPVILGASCHLALEGKGGKGKGREALVVMWCS